MLHIGHAMWLFFRVCVVWFAAFLFIVCYVQLTVLAISIVHIWQVVVFLAQWLFVRLVHRVITQHAHTHTLTFVCDLHLVV